MVKEFCQHLGIFAFLFCFLVFLFHNYFLKFFMFILVPFTPTFLSGVTAASQSSQPAVDPQSIAKQQADLQAKILSILNPGGGAKTSSGLNTGSLPSQQTVSPSQKQGAVTAPAAQTAAKPATLSTTVKPIFPLYPAQQKPAASATGAAVSTARVPAGATAAQGLYSTPANQVGTTYQSASPYGNTAVSSSYGASSMTVKQVTTYQFSKPVAQTTYTTGSSQAAASTGVYAARTTAATAYSVGTQGVQRIGQQTSATSASIPVVSKFSPAGQAVATTGGQRPAVNSAPRASAAVGGPRPVIRAPSPAGRSILGAPPAGTPRVLAPSGTARTSTPSGSPGVRMVAPRGPSPVGRGAVRTPSPAGFQGQTIPSRGGAVSVRGGVQGAVAGAGRTLGRSATTPVRGALVQRGAPASRGAPTTRGAPSPRGAPATRGAPAPRGAPTPRGALTPRGAPTNRGSPARRGAPAPRGGPAPRGAPVTRGTPYTRGAPNGRGAPSTQGTPIRAVTPGGFANRGAPRGRPMMRGGPPYRGGGRGGY